MLGMWLAQKYAENPERFVIEQVKWIWILIGAVFGVGLTGFMGWKGGILKLYNDIPSLIAFLSCLLIVYKIGVKYINKFFVWASGFGYELYLVHSLVYSIMRTLQLPCFGDGKVAAWLWLGVMFVVAYLVAFGYSWIIKKLGYEKVINVQFRKIRIE